MTGGPSSLPPAGELHRIRFVALFGGVENPGQIDHGKEELRRIQSGSNADGKGIPLERPSDN